MFTFVAQPYPCRYLIKQVDKQVFNIADMECHMYISWVVFYCLMLMLDPKCCEANPYICVLAPSPRFSLNFRLLPNSFLVNIISLLL